MKNIARAIQVEVLKARRSRMPVVTMLAFSLAPYAAGFFMIVLKDPELAKRLGMISVKAQIVAGEADWPTFLGILSQATALGGLILFSLVSSWVFGREYSDRTIRNILALPTPRYTIVMAKFILVLLWSSILVVMIYLIGLGVGAAIGDPGPEKSKIEVSSETQSVPVDAIIVKQSLEEAITPLRKSIIEGADKAVARIQRILKERTNPDDIVIIAGIGNTAGVGIA